MITRRTLLKTAAGALAVPAPGPAKPTHARLRQLLDGLIGTCAVAALAELREPAGAWRGASGTTLLGGDAPAPVGGRFRMGSITKSFVATVVLQLAGEGRLSLDDTLERRLPGVLPYAGRVTVRQLLQHTSGVVNYTNTPAFRAIYGSEAEVVRLRERTWTAAELVAYVEDQPLRFEPGSSWLYSNTNFVLLGMVVERVTGSPYAVEIGRRVLRPLGLGGTRAPGTDAGLPGPHPHGYLPVDGEPVDITVLNPSVAGASGEMTSAPGDLNAFLRALVGGRLLRPAQRAEMLTARVTGRDYDYGLGLMTRLTPGGTRLWGHSGDIFGYYAEAWTTADGARQFTVAVTPWGDTEPGALAGALVDAAFTR